MQFDHVRDKKYNLISELVVHGYSITKIQEELNKCEVRCANCHIIKTEYERKYKSYKFLNKPTGNRPKIVKKQQYILNFCKDKYCSRCKETNILTFHFHHLTDKIDEISNMIRNTCSIEQLMLEIDKCIILCANCHQIEHTEEKPKWQQI